MLSELYFFEKCYVSYCKYKKYFVKKIVFNQFVAKLVAVLTFRTLNR